MSDWDEQAMKIFGDAAEIADVSEQTRFVEKACGDNTELRQRVDSMFSANDRAAGGDFLEAPVTDVYQRTLARPAEAVGSTIDKYKILQEVGEGGFGVVYMAQQTEPVKRRVALKIIKPGMDSREVTARFEAERQALALMEHPNIAKVIDAGMTAEGRPYFVMELVKGVPITEFCDDNNLQTRDRLKLFASVCRAVQHAHQKGVIHRDLKPSNVMVTMNDGEPMAKVIDFGVAKAINQELTEKTLFTAYGQMVGTPQYMSPEQAQINAMDVDTRSDVYSLGVLLYELITGAPPLNAERLRKSGFDEMRRIIREDEPPKPSQRLSTLGQGLRTVAKHHRTDAAKLQGFVQGDIDWIVMKALDKDRNRRYESPSDFANDIGRFLDDKPIEARPPSSLYRMSRFVKRNRGLVATVGVVAAAVLAGLAASSYGLIEARRENKRATLASQKSEAVLAVMQDLIYWRSESAETVEMLDDFAERLPQIIEQRGLENNKEVEAEVRFSIGHKYHDLEYVEKSRVQLRKALELGREAYPPSDLRLARFMQEFSWALLDRFALDDSRLHRIEAELIAKEGAAIEAAHASRGFGRMMEAFALSLQNRFNEAIEVFDSLGSDDWSNEPKSVAKMGLAACHWRAGQYREALDLTQQVHGLDRQLTSAKKGMASAIAGNCYYELGSFQEANECFEQAITFISPDNKSHFIYIDTVKSWSNVMLALGEFDKAEAILKECRESCLRDQHIPHELFALRGLVNIYVANGRYERAETNLKTIVSLTESELGEGSFSAMLAKCRLAKLYVITGQQDLADPLFESCQGPLRRYADSGGNLPDLVAEWVSAVAHCSTSSDSQLREVITALDNVEAIPRYQRHTALAALAAAKARIGDSSDAIFLLQKAFSELTIGETFDWVLAERLLLDDTLAYDVELDKARSLSTVFRAKYSPRESSNAFD